MAAVRICNRHDVEKEGVDVKVKRLVVEEEFCEQAEELAVAKIKFRDSAINSI